MDDSRKYNPVTPKAKDDMRPGFLGGKGGGERPSGMKAENEAAAKGLADAEAAASFGAGAGADGGVSDAQERESGAGGFYRGEGVNDRVGRAVGAVRDFKKGNFKGAFKKAGPGLAIFLVIFLVGGIMSGTQFFQPFSLIAQLQESFNSMHVSAYNRSARMLRYQMANGTRKSPLKTTIFGTQKLALSKKQIAEYERQGIKYHENYEGTGIRVLEYETEGGQKRLVTANKADADVLKKAKYPAASFDAMLNDTTFNHKFDAASQPWRGQFANWFGTDTNSFLSKNKVTRNLWKDFKEKKDAAISSGKKSLDAGLEVMKEKLKARLTGGQGGGVARREVSQDDEGNVRDETTSSSNSKTDSEKIASKLQDIKGKISGGANVACAVVDFIGVVNLMVAAEEALQIVAITSSYMEAVDKTKAGYGDEAPINEIAATLNESIKVDHTVIADGETKAKEGGESVVVPLASRSEEGTAKSAMQSAGMAALYGNGLVDIKDPSAQSFNMTASMSRILGGVGMGMESFEGCLLGRGVAAVGSIATDFVMCLLSACIGTLFKDIGLNIAKALAIQAVIAVITPWLVDVFKRDMLTNLAGEDLGNLLVSGGNMYQGNVHKANGGSLSSRKKYTEFAVAQQQVIAEEAKMERETLSPFDLTSKNTFMGSLMTQLMAFNTSNSLMSVVSAGGSVMSSSLVAMTPNTSAIASTIAESLPTDAEYEKICPYLWSIGAIGDSYCNPYMVTDVSTLDDDPGDVILTVGESNLENINGDGNVKIKQDSDLMKYITYCSERVSQFGVADQSIVADFSPANTGNDVADAIIGVAPILGDLQDIINSGAQATGLGYISGASCVATTGTAASADLGSEAPNWNRAKYYQRFIEDQSLAESMGIIDKSAVTIALEEYYEENPLDNSYEGMLVRYSGLDKETVTDLLDVIAYYNYIDAYDASERYAFGAPVVDAGEQPLLFENEQTMDGAAVALEGVVYRDLRNRSFAV